MYIYTLIMLCHFKKSASILTDQETQMVGNDRWPATICNTDRPAGIMALKPTLLLFFVPFTLWDIGQYVFVIVC